VHGIAAVAVVLLSSSVWADTILLQFTPPPSYEAANIIVTPGAEPTQVSTDNFEGTFVSGNGAWVAAHHPENGFLFGADINSIVIDEYQLFNGDVREDDAYFIGFTAPGSNIFFDGIGIEFTRISDEGYFSFQIKAYSSLQGSSCDQFDLVPGQPVTGDEGGGECFPFADGAVHDLGLFTGVDDLEVQMPTPPAGAVPEPGSLLLLATGLGGLAGLRCKRATRN